MAAIFHSPVIFLSLITFLKYTAPSHVDKSEWEKLNSDLKKKLYPLHLLIGQCNDPADLQVLGEKVSLEIFQFCSAHSELFLQEEQDRPREKFVSHTNKTVSQLEALKKTLRKEAFKNCGDVEKRKAFHECIMALSELKKA